MNKQNLLYPVIILLIFTAGFLIGHQSNDNGRFQSQEVFHITDTKKGILYIFRGKDFLVLNIKTGEKKIVQIKNTNSDNLSFDKQATYRELLEN